MLSICYQIQCNNQIWVMRSIGKLQLRYCIKTSLRFATKTPFMYCAVFKDFNISSKRIMSPYFLKQGGLCSENSANVSSKGIIMKKLRTSRRNPKWWWNFWSDYKFEYIFPKKSRWIFVSIATKLKFRLNSKNAKFQHSNFPKLFWAFYTF